jgi:hypothetical protein
MLLAPSFRYAIGTLLGGLAVIAGVTDLLGESRPVQCDRETPLDWISRRRAIWPLANGAALGFGATSRVGFWLWYSVPIGSVLSAWPPAGAVIWGIYGFTRSVSAGVIWYRYSRSEGRELGQVLTQFDRARLTTSSLTIVLGVTLFILLGV